MGNSATVVPGDTRRWLQLGLAAIWLYAGILQAQSYMFTDDFAKQELLSAASGNPGWIANSISWSAHIVQLHPVAWNSAFVAVQVALGIGIAFRPTLRPALAASVAWSLLVWWFGEGLGGLLVGGTVMGGAPGAVLLYAVLAVLLWPPGKRHIADTARFVAARPIGAPAAKIVWVVLWVGLAALNLQPSSLAPGGLRDTVSGMGAGQPGWINGAVEVFTSFSKGNGTWLTIIGTVLLVLIAAAGSAGGLLQRSAVIAAVVVSLFVWLFGQALGAPFGGHATDPNSGPLLVLIAVAYWPAIQLPSHREAVATPATATPATAVATPRTSATDKAAAPNKTPAPDRAPAT